MEENTVNTKKFGRFTKHIILGGVISGLLAAIPILNCLNIIFCLLNMASIVFALWLYLKSHAEDTVTIGESAGFGAAAGAGAGLILGIINMVFGAALAALSAPLFENLPGAESSTALAAATVSGVATFLMIPINVILFAGFGALAGALGMQFFFKTRINRP